MTTSTQDRRAQDGRMPVYGVDGDVIATIGAARSAWLGTLLAECPRHHVYILPEDVRLWSSADAACPRCRVLGLA